MCYYLYLASPLTLSEVRSMLAPGLSAELLGGAESRGLLALHPDAQTVTRLLHGACSCDLVRYRKPVAREDEAHLRERYRKLGLSRDDMIRSLEKHRRGLDRRQKPEGHWPVQVASFVVEHARNAGSTLYFLDFSHTGDPPATVSAAPITVTVDHVRANPGDWLPEETPTMVLRNR